MKKQKRLQLLSVVLPMAAALLSALPNVVRMDWMGGYVTYCSGYSLLPVGYGIGGPFCAAVCALVLTVLSAAAMRCKRKPLAGPLTVVAVLAALLSLSVALFGLITVAGGVIALLLAGDAVVLFLLKQANSET